MKYRERLYNGQIPWRILTVLLIALLGADLLVHHHEYFGIEDAFGFHVWLALLAAAAGVGLAALLGWVLRRPEETYDD